MLKSIVIVLLGLTLGLQAQTKAQKAFMQYCMHDVNEAQMHTMQSIAKQTTRQRSCNYLARYLVPIDSHRAIRLRNSNITDITPLKYLKGINEVSLSGNNITDITPLAQLTELTRVDLGNNPITEIKSLIGLKKLKSLSLRSTSKLEDISPLLDMIYLRELYYSDGNKNLKYLKYLKYLKNLSIGRNQVKNLKYLKNLKNLKYLSLYKTGLKDISDITYLETLSEILLTDQSLLVNISEMQNLKRLSRVDFENVNINNISALKDLPNLNTLILHNTKVKDLSILSGKNIKLDVRDNDLKWCSPKKWDDLIKGVSCYEKDGTEKSWWKRLLRL